MSKQLKQLKATSTRDRCQPRAHESPITGSQKSSPHLRPASQKTALASKRGVRTVHEKTESELTFHSARDDIRKTRLTNFKFTNCQTGPTPNANSQCSADARQIASVHNRRNQILQHTTRSCSSIFSDQVVRSSGPINSIRVRLPPPAQHRAKTAPERPQNLPKTFLLLLV